MTPRDDAVPPGFEAHTEAGPERRPLYRELSPAPAFPLDAMGALRPAADAISALTQAPSALCAQSVLGAASLAVSPHFDVSLPTGQTKPTALLCASVAASGERKTSVDAHATAAIRIYERELAAGDESARSRYWADREAWKAASEAAKAAHKKHGRGAIRDALEAIGPEPKAPPLPMLLISDPTPEAIALSLADGRPFAGLFTDEGGTLIGGHSFSDESRMRMAGLLNSLWDGSPIRRLRVLTGNRYAPGRRLAAHVMMQSIVAEKLLGDEMLADMGLLARILVISPESHIGRRPWRDPDPSALATLKEYDANILRLLRKPPRMGDAGALDPLPLPLSPEARNVMIQFHDAIERQIGKDGTMATIRAFAAKGAEHACRIAAVMAAISDPDVAEIGADDAERGCVLVHHYAQELIRLGEGARVAPDLRLAARLLEWWQARPHPAVHLAQIYQRGLNALGNAARARESVGILEEHGWVRRLPERTIVDGRPRRDAWTLT
jgi:hypothetical protein